MLFVISKAEEWESNLRGGAILIILFMYFQNLDFVFEKNTTGGRS